MKYNQLNKISNQYIIS